MFLVLWLRMTAVSKAAWPPAAQLVPGLSLRNHSRKVMNSVALGLSCCRHFMHVLLPVVLPAVVVLAEERTCYHVQHIIII